MCDGGALKMPVESEWTQPVLGAHAIHFAQHRCLVRRHARVRREGAHKQYESSKK
jgi:hypothetical protein